MPISIFGANEHNLKNIDLELQDGLTVVTGVSGSGKTSLVFDTIYHEAQRRFLDVYLYGRGGKRLQPAKVARIHGLGPTIAVGQNLLNRNPNSTLATASGLHPFFRLLYTNFGERHCLKCQQPMNVFSEDEILETLLTLSREKTLHVYAPIVHNVRGSHQTLLSALAAEFGNDKLLVDEGIWDFSPLKSDQPHTIEIYLGKIQNNQNVSQARELVRQTTALGAGAIRARSEKDQFTLTSTLVCAACGEGLGELQPTHFNQNCPYCEGERCSRCDKTGMHPQAASTRWKGMRFSNLLELSIDQVRTLFKGVLLPSTAERLLTEISRRVEALHRVGLGYLTLNRSSPTLSRGESQRVRIALSLSSRLEDMLHVLDEPTIGQHPADVARFLPAFRDLPGPVIYVEHDRVAAAHADQVVDLGPGAGDHGGEVIFQGTPADLWNADTPTGNHFSLRSRVLIPKSRQPPENFLVIEGADKHNLKSVEIKIPLERMTVVTGVSGSGKSTLVEHVLVPTLKKGKAVGCDSIQGDKIKPVMVDQSPIGRNPRSNPATYTNLSDSIRELFSAATGLSKSHFSFNRPEGACPECKGTGASEIKMRYLPSIWLPCEVCEGERFKQVILDAKISFGSKELSIADIYNIEIKDINDLILDSAWLSPARKKSAQRILRALNHVGLGYLELGQPSPTLSGGEAQRVKLTKVLARKNLASQLLILDEPSTGLHPKDLNGLLVILDRLVKQGATIVIVEHNPDIIRAADWVIDLGPGAGPQGGDVLYQGELAGLLETDASITGRILKEELNLEPPKTLTFQPCELTNKIIIRNARANNLKGVNVEIPKRKITVVTGVSGSGKSSLVEDVLGTEARRRFLETLSMYERQGIQEGAEARVDSISGLGVTLTVNPQSTHTWSQIPQFTRRSSVGAITEISHHLAIILAFHGKRSCSRCGSNMVRQDVWICPTCNTHAQIAQPRHFSTTHWSSSCDECNGLGSIFLPAPEKLIIEPQKPLCAGAMYSPGYWPQSYLCKDQPIIAEIGKHYGFDPIKTPWNEMSEKAQQAFLFGDGLEYTWTYISKGGRSKGQEKQSTWTWHGFYGEESWIFDWDVHGTYTNKAVCQECGGAGLKTEYLNVTLLGKNIYQLSELPLTAVETTIKGIHLRPEVPPNSKNSLKLIRRRLGFLCQVGIGYVHLNRPTGTLSAGEAQRIQLASLLGSELSGLTILADEPSRGMHPVELEALCHAFKELREEGNTVILVEHDPLIINTADHIIDIGPGAGTAGGEIIAQGTPAEIVEADTPTGKWLRGQNKEPVYLNRDPKDWMVIEGARENNLRGEEVHIPLNTLTGICGVSGSGKSTLVIDTLGRALVKKTHTSSFSRTPITPGEFDCIKNKPKRTFLVDQSRKGIHNPSNYLGLDRFLRRIYADSDDAKALGLTKKELKQTCTSCRGKGRIRIDMGFLPDEWVGCETCKGTGYSHEAWEVRIRGISLPEVNEMTIDQVYLHFDEADDLITRLDTLRQVGLGYLTWKQPAISLSGGETQRLKIAKELIKKTRHKTLYILDEPTVGLHLDDVARLVEVLHNLAQEGHTVVTVEHSPHLLASCDWIIELGPVGGPDGGHIIATGKPEEVAKLKTPTAPYLKTLIRDRL